MEADDDLQFVNDDDDLLLERKLPSWYPPYLFAAMDTLFMIVGCIPSRKVCIDSLLFLP